MYSILASTCNHHLRYSHTLPYSPNPPAPPTSPKLPSSKPPFSDSTFPSSPPISPPSIPALAPLSQPTANDLLTQQTAIDPLIPFCAACTFHHSLTRQLEQAKAHFATFKPHSWKKPGFQRALEARNRLVALSSMVGSQGAGTGSESGEVAGNPVLDGEKNAIPEERGSEDGHASTKAKREEDTSPIKVEEADPPSPPPRPQKKPRRNTIAGLRATFMPTASAVLPTELETAYRSRQTYWRPGLRYEPGKWTAPEGEEWEETSNMEMEWEKPRERKKLKKGGKRKGKGKEEGNEEDGEGGEEGEEVNPRRLRSWSGRGSAGGEEEGGGGEGKGEGKDGEEEDGKVEDGDDKEEVPMRMKPRSLARKKK